MSPGQGPKQATAGKHSPKEQREKKEKKKKKQLSVEMGE